jgi:hypothetical protein
MGGQNCFPELLLNAETPHRWNADGAAILEKIQRTRQA